MKHSFPVKIKDVQKETESCISISFDINDELKDLFQYKPGQYITIIKNINGIDFHRSYSLCSSPFENEWRVAIKKIEGGVFSTYANDHFKIGDLIEIMPPDGKFTSNINELNTKAYLFIASGSGITPILSLIKSILLIEKNSQVTLIYGNQKSDTIIFKNTLLALKNKYLRQFQVHFILSQEDQDEELFNGRINADKIIKFNNKIFFPDQLDEVFICGPEEMILSVKEALISCGINEHKIHFELFGAPVLNLNKLIPQESTGQVSKINLKIDGRTLSFVLPFGTQSILDAALNKNANLPYSCKGGVCCTCKAKLIDGEVSMNVNYGLEPDEIANGYILTCQSYPKTTEINIDFDQ